MITRMISVEAVEIADLKGLDPIQVFWSNLGNGRGSVVITCFGCAWMAYFGAMGPHTIQEFFSEVDTCYLVTKLGITPLLKQRKADHVYLSRIVNAIKESLAAMAQGACR